MRAPPRGRTRTLIIGSGISAAAYAATAPRDPQERRHAVGGPHLWQHLDPEHRMGQPHQLLTGQVLPDAQRRDDPARQRDFMRTRDFGRRVDETLEEHTDRVEVAAVESVRPDPAGGYTVVIRGERGARFQEHFDRVVIAAGPGPARLLEVTPRGEDPEQVDVAAMAGHVVSWRDFMSPDWRQPATLLPSRQVAVYGGSATAAWVAELALLRGYTVSLWFTRPGRRGSPWDPESRFSEAFPAGGRNVAVQRQTRNVRRVLRLEAVRLIRTPRHAFLGLRLAGQTGADILCTPDLLVYALGSEHTPTTGIGAMLGGGLLGALAPFYDRSRAISDDQCLLALGTPDRSLLIVGSALQSRGGLSRDQAARQIHAQISPYADIGNSLPPAARPAEGIAIVMAGLEAFHDFMPARPQGRPTTFEPEDGPPTQHHTQYRWDINFNTCNRTQLAAFIAQTTDLAPFAANLAVELIIGYRTQPNRVFGLSAEHVGRICRMSERFWGGLQRVNPAANRRGDGYHVKLHEYLARVILDRVDIGG